MLNLKNKFVKGCFLSVDRNKALTLDFIIGLADFSNQEIEHNDQHEEEIEEPE